MTGARVTWTGPNNVPGGTIIGLSTGEGEGITHPVVQEAYDNVPNDKRFDPRMHGSCAKVEALSKEAEKANVTNMEELRKLAKNSVQSEQEYYQSNERYTFAVKRKVALSLIGFPLAAFFVSLLLPNQRLIRIDRRRRMTYVKDDQFYIHQLPEWTVYDDIEKVNLPLFLSHEGLHFVLPDSKMKELYLVKVGRLGLINIQGLQMFIQDFLSGKYIHFAHTTSAKSWNILDILLGKAFYSDKYTSEEIEKAIENYQKNWVNLSFEEQKVRAEKLYQDMQEKLQNKMSNLKIILGIIMLIYAIFHLLRAFRLV